MVGSAGATPTSQAALTELSSIPPGSGLGRFSFLRIASSPCQPGHGFILISLPQHRLERARLGR